MLFEVEASPGWRYAPKPHSFENTPTAVLAAQIGRIPDGATAYDVEELFGTVSVGVSENYKEVEWRCNIWTRDCLKLLVSKR